MEHASSALSMWKPGALTEREPIPETWVEAIFTRLSAQLGSKIADLYGGVDPAAVKTEWADALSGFDPSEISRGLTACQARVFAPTLGEFLRLCRPALDPEIAWLEAVEGMAARENGRNGEWSHPAVYRAASSMAYELRTSDFKAQRKRWEWLLNREFPKGWLLGVPGSMVRIGNGGTETRAPNAAERQALAELRGKCAPHNPGTRA